MVNLEDIKKLRQETGSGIMDCRKALEVSKGDFNKAKRWLKEKGILRAAKKQDRATVVGMVEAYIHSNSQVGAMVQLNCETDFVAQTKDFKKLSYEIAMQVAAMNPKDVKTLLNQEYIRDPKIKITDLVNQAIAKLGENIKIKKIARIAVSTK